MNNDKRQKYDLPNDYLDYLLWNQQYYQINRNLYLQLYDFIYDSLYNLLKDQLTFQLINAINNEH
jgi:hypothetical protein